MTIGTDRSERQYVLRAPVTDSLLQGPPTLLRFCRFPKIAPAREQAIKT